jgi:peptidyl-prolyl cis-trans isomerase SurA
MCGKIRKRPEPTPDMPMIQLRRYKIIPSLAVLAIAGLALMPRAAEAQVAAIVNGEPVTAHDIAERTKLHRNSGKPNIARREVLEELIEYKLKLQIAQRASIDPTAAEVNRAFAGMAQRSGRSPEQFEQALRQGGIDPARLKARVKADLAWQQYLQANANNVIVRDADLVAVMTARGQNMNLKSVQYTMQQVIFVTRRGAPDNVRQMRLKEAEGLRARVVSCDQIETLARQHNEVVIKPRVSRFASDLSPNLQKLLQSLPDGRMTPPEVTANGIEVVAICDRKEVPADISSNRELRNELLGQRLQNYEKRILEKMRQTSIIRILDDR